MTVYAIQQTMAPWHLSEISCIYPPHCHSTHIQELGKKAVDYWLIANSYSPHWGMHGLFKIRRGTNECGIESTPAAGTPDLDLPKERS